MVFDTHRACLRTRPFCPPHPRLLGVLPNHFDPLSLCRSNGDGTCSGEIIQWSPGRFYCRHHYDQKMSELETRDRAEREQDRADLECGRAEVRSRLRSASVLHPASEAGLETLRATRATWEALDNEKRIAAGIALLNRVLKDPALGPHVEAREGLGGKVVAACPEAYWRLLCISRCVLPDDEEPPDVTVETKLGATTTVSGPDAAAAPANEDSQEAGRLSTAPRK